MTDKAIEPAKETDWRSRVFLLGGLLGAVLGLLTAYLYVRAAEEQGAEPPASPGTGDAVRLGVSLLSIVRTITEWGTR